MTVRVYPDGTPRLAAEVMIEAGSGCWLVTLRCHGEDLQLTIPVPGLIDVPAALEAILCSGNVPWRPYSTWKGKPKGKPAPKKA